MRVSRELRLDACSWLTTVGDASSSRVTSFAWRLRETSSPVAMNRLVTTILLSLLSAVHSYIIPHAHPFGPVGPGKVFVPYPTYVGHIPFGHHPHVVHPPVFVIAHHPPQGDKPTYPGPSPDGHPGDVPFYPPQFPGYPGSFPNDGPGIVVPPPPEEPKPEGGPHPGDAPKPQGPECTLCGGGGDGGGNGNGNGPAGPTPDEGGRGDEDPPPGVLTPKGGVPETEPKPEEPKPEEPAPEPNPEDEPKPEEPAPEEPKPEEPQPEQPVTEAPTTQAPTTEPPAAEEPKPEEEPKTEEAMPEREGPEPGEDKSSEEDETAPTEAPASARLQFAKKGGTFVL